MSKPVPRTQPADVLMEPVSANATKSQAAQAPPPQQQKGKAARKPTQKPTPEELSQMIQSKISELQTEQKSIEEEEEELASQVRKATTELSELVNAQNTQGDKIDVIQQKYMELFQEHKRLERELGKIKRKSEQAAKDKDSAKAEVSKLTSQKQKIETVCRELQKENKRIKEESKRLAVSEQQKREELSSKFEATIWEIKSRMEEDTDDKKRRAEDAEEAKDRFKSFLTQYQALDHHYKSILKTKDVETQLVHVKLDQQRRLTEQEQFKVAALQAQVATYVAREEEWRAAMEGYVERWRAVEEALGKGSETFNLVRKEMEQMQRNTART
ncbi:hypothetical protein M427DRAFT_54946 [Gonapodya prolifera JEL478]|uniref:Uncharacterized protein n=1 Tax=Gonapodya prolifera (strain JEL478) TaxID=1344416 RepID=A0A139AK24_GONPJ|nr:hypothetical protein M427DRAFT_54946 [Gonapodya prolifera JEL478]|eukprot:KXS16904.1 hypothetical protein M427DRAFT_54946 [Gonapodya prolifera JEL478]